MAIKCATEDEAIAAAKVFKQNGHTRPAAIHIVIFGKGHEPLEWWAVADSEDLDTLNHGYIESLTVL